MRQGRSRWATIAATTACALLCSSLCGCMPETVEEQLPPGVTVDVYQSRIDYGEHKLEVSIRNGTTQPLEIHALEFSSPSFTPAAEYGRAPSTVSPNTATDFRLLLPVADCEAAVGPPLVKLTYSFGGQTGTVSTVPKDRLGQLPGIRTEDCRESEVRTVATITPMSPIEYTTLGTEPVARLAFSAVPTGAGGTLVIDDVRGTVLLNLVDEKTGSVTDSVPLGLDVGAATTPVTFTLTLAPARCDPHAVAEDKRGTFFPFTMTTRQDTGRVFLGVSDAQRAELYDFIHAACAGA